MRNKLFSIMSATLLVLGLFTLSVSLPQSADAQPNGKGVSTAVSYTDLDTQIPLDDSSQHHWVGGIELQKGAWYVTGQATLAAFEEAEFSVTCELRHDGERFSVLNVGLGQVPGRSDRDTVTLVGVVNVENPSEVSMVCRNFDAVSGDNTYATDVSLVGVSVHSADVQEFIDD